MHHVEIFTDGACSGNPGPMGVGVVLRNRHGYRREISKHMGRGTSNRAELAAVVEGLRVLTQPEHTRVTLYTDSTYVTGLLSGRYRAKANHDLVNSAKAFVSQCAGFEVKKVPGHAGVKENERCDQLAKQASKK